MNILEKEGKLIELAIKYDCDKWNSHFYMKYYAKHLPETCRIMMEIGIAKGASGCIWEDYFGKENLDLHFFDLFLDPNHVSPRWARNKGWIPHIGDQGSIVDLADVREKFEVLIDDGSHRADHMLISWKHLFLHNCQSGALYVIEDLNCNKADFYWGGFVKSFEDTPWWMFKNFLETGELVNPYFNEGEAQVFKSLIASVDLYEDEGIVFIKRK